MDEKVRCSECDLEMEQGFIPDTTYGAVWQTCWHRGDPKEKKPFLEKLSSGSGVRYDRKEMCPILCYRCPRCGLLKLYGVEAEDES